MRKRLLVIPREQDRLIEGYSKGFIPDDRMRARMSALQQEGEDLKAKAAELELRLSELELTEEQEANAVSFAERVGERPG